jgi:hypothetical protein
MGMHTFMVLFSSLTVAFTVLQRGERSWGIGVGRGWCIIAPSSGYAGTFGVSFGVGGLSPCALMVPAIVVAMASFESKLVESKLKAFDDAPQDTP